MSLFLCFLQHQFLDFPCSLLTFIFDNALPIEILWGLSYMNENAILRNERRPLRDPSEQQPFGSFFYFKVNSGVEPHSVSQRFRNYESAGIIDFEGHGMTTYHLPLHYATLKAQGVSKVC